MRGFVAGYIPGNKEMVSNRSKNSIKLFEQLGTGYFGTQRKDRSRKEKVHRVDFT